MAIMDERIQEHLKLLNKYHLLLLDVKKVKLDEYLQDSMIQGSSERFLQLAIESCLNIGNRLISLYQSKKPLSTPETYADIFIQLEKLGAIDRDLSDRLVKMARFRNLLVHIYWEIDSERVYDVIQNDLDDFRLFPEKK